MFLTFGTECWEWCVFHQLCREVSYFQRGLTSLETACLHPWGSQFVLWRCESTWGSWETDWSSLSKSLLEGQRREHSQSSRECGWRGSCELLSGTLLFITGVNKSFYRWLLTVHGLQIWVHKKGSSSYWDVWRLSHFCAFILQVIPRELGGTFRRVIALVFWR